MTATLAPIDRLLDRLDGVKRTGATTMARCPGHDDSVQSLAVSIGDDGRVLLHCHAGCATDDVVRALGLDVRDLFPAKGSDSGTSRVVAEYSYVDEAGATLYIVERRDPKRFVQKRPTATGWVWKLGDVRRVPYRLPQVIEGVAAGRWIVVVEGERDADNLRARGFVATTNAGGAGKWRSEWAPMFAGAKVAILPDNDDAGRQHAEQVAAMLAPVAEAVKIIKLDGLAERADVTDWLSGGRTADELKALIAATSEWHTTSDEHERVPEPPPLAFEPRILDAFRREVLARGLVGEDRNAAILYLVVTSRVLDRQVSAGVKGHSSSGKSYTVETVVKFFPPGEVIEFTAMSEKALVYSTRDFRHRTLVIYELTALRENVEDDLTSYFVRTLLSEGRINYEVTVRGSDGNFTTKQIVKEGPTNLIFTTTKTTVHPENETRVLSLNTDDSKEQTARVLLELANETNGGTDLAAWHDLQEWLAESEHRVAIPYARRLAELIPPVAVRLRRDFGALLSLVRAHAMLHQATRDRDATGAIIATIDDYAVVRDLVAANIAESVNATVSATVRETVAAVDDLTALDAETGPDEAGGGVTTKAVAAQLDVDKSNALRRLQRTADDGYVVNLETRRGRPGRWVLGDDRMPDDVDLLPEPADLDDGCAVARAPEGKEGPAQAWLAHQIAQLDQNDPNHGLHIAKLRAEAVRLITHPREQTQPRNHEQKTP